MELTFKQWIDFQFPINEVIIGGSDCVKLKKYTGSDSPQDHLIGLEPTIDKTVFLKFIHAPASNSNLAYCNINCEGLRVKRKKNCKKIHSYKFLTFEGFSCGGPIPHGNYFKSLLSHKFCICPEGNGEDTHRHYESLLFKCIPIIEYPDNNYCLHRWNKKSTIEKKYKNLPVLYTHKYENLTEQYLYNTYKSFMNKKFNFSSLFKSYWLKKSNSLEVNSSFWLRHLSNKTWS